MSVHLSRIIFAVIVFLTCASCSSNAVPTVPVANTSEPELSANLAAIPTEPNLKVAFIGDTNYGNDYGRVLRLVQAEGATMIVHLGDMDYQNNPAGFEAKLNSILGPNFPYFIAIGNHDVESWRTDCSNTKGCYARNFKERMSRLGITFDDTVLNRGMYSIAYRGLKMVFVGQEIGDHGDTSYAPFIAEQFADDKYIWKICGWHKNQSAMQVGDKTNEMGWKTYETCKNRGAIIATAHEHSYQRTKTLTSIENQIVDPTWRDPNRLRVAPGASFVFVSGLGGQSIRDQERCLPATYPYGCKQEWAKIYTSNQGAEFGALFIVFNINGDPYQARGYFKNVSGKIVDEFEINADQ